MANNIVFYVDILGLKITFFWFVILPSERNICSFYSPKMLCSHTHKYQTRKSKPPAQLTDMSCGLSQPNTDLNAIPHEAVF